MTDIQWEALNIVLFTYHVLPWLIINLTEKFSADNKVVKALDDKLCLHIYHSPLTVWEDLSCSLHFPLNMCQIAFNPNSELFGLNPQ